MYNWNLWISAKEIIDMSDIVQTHIAVNDVLFQTGETNVQMDV